MTAADQPTTDPSVTTAAERDALPLGHVVRSASGTIACRATEAFGVVFGDSRTFPWGDLALPLTVLYPAPRPAADTETEVQWGVRDKDGVTPCGDGEQMARDYVTFVDSSATVVQCTVTTTTTVTRTPWEEA